MNTLVIVLIAAVCLFGAYVKQWASHAHQQAHLKQPHMARLREIKEHYIETTQVGIVTFNDA